ncbi:MAG: hypothetical protein LQ338_002252 [Usnochroma carphineum]|nr:MAG: hypothetical protein LQ338_002252 [Usnochroma carphineum]
MGLILSFAAVLSVLTTFTSASVIQARAVKASPLRIPMRQLSHGPAFNIKVGNPPQDMTVLDDWTWHSTWLYTPHCKGHYSIPDCVLPGQNFFDSMKSSTLKNASDADQTFLGTDYTPGAPFTVSFATDEMCLPNGKNPKGLCQKNVEVELSNLAFEFPTVQDIGGIIGLAPVLPGFNATYYPAAYQFMEAGQLDRIVGWHMCAGLKNKDTCQGQDYLTIYGGTDTSIYRPSQMQDHDIVVSPCINAGNLQLTPARSNYWSASWTGFWIGNKSIPLSTPTTAMPDPPVPSCSSINPIAIFDEGGLGRGAPVPLAAFSTLTSVTKATVINSTSALPLNEGKQGLWAVDCNAIRSLPDLVYELSGKQKITVTPQMYIDRDVMPGKCLLNARTWDRTTAGAQTFFGQTVLARTYLKYDFEGLKVGIAPVRRELWK